MSLKQDIVVVNEFTVKGSDGTGSRGSSPKRYLEEYMLRKDAVEVVAPVRRERLDDFVTRYMLRDSAVEAVSFEQAISGLVGIDAHEGGVAFSLNSPSLSHEEARVLADKSQRAFEEGSTVFKTVISFSQDYLKRTGVVPEDLEVMRPGDYRHQVDVLKLNMAVGRGVARLKPYFGDLHMVGTIQTDTEHVHAHLILWDEANESPRKIRSGEFAGQEKGKLSSKEKDLLRRGIDNFLDVKQKVPFFSASLDFERRNIRSFVERFTREHMRQLYDVQLIDSLLPASTSRHRPKSNARDMKECNAVTRRFVEEILSDERVSDAYHQAVDGYLTARQGKESRSPYEWAHTQKTIYEKTIQYLMSGVYKTISEFRSETEGMPALRDLSGTSAASDLLSKQDVVLAPQHVVNAKKSFVSTQASFDVFGRYLKRLKKARRLRDFYASGLADWEAADELGRTQAVGDFYRIEHEYYSRLAHKYSALCGVWGIDSSVINKVRSRVRAVEKSRALFSFMAEDVFLKNLRDNTEESSKNSAEEYVKRVYGVDDGAKLVDSNATFYIQQRIKELDDEVKDARSSWQEVLDFYDIEEDENGRLRLCNFHDAQKNALVDLHLACRDIETMNIYETGGQIRLSEHKTRQTRSWLNKRSDAYSKAMSFFQQTGQSIDEFGESATDIVSWNHFLDTGNSNNVEETSLSADIDRVKKLEMSGKKMQALHEKVRRNVEGNMTNFAKILENDL